VVGLFGLRQMRRWVIQPVSALREAAVRIGGGDFSWRVQASSGDELGQLAGEVNQMAASIARMQGELVEHERREVAGHALRCIVHNIRSPLTGIRWLAEAISMRKDVDSATVAEQNRIVVTVDHVLEWLQGFRDSLAATSLHLEDVDVLDMVTSAATRCGGAVIERGGRVNVSTSGDPRRVRVERVPFEAAISSLVCQTARIDGGALDVHVEVGRPVGRPGHWHIIVEASGPEPSLSAALAGSVSASGEYAMADRVIRLHGGSLEQVADSPSRLRTVILMPG
jgi:signal transduction histidine kinase